MIAKEPIKKDKYICESVGELVLPSPMKLDNSSMEAEGFADFLLYFAVYLSNCRNSGLG